MSAIFIQPLETPRLRLRRLTIGDAPLFFSRLGGNSAVTRYMLWKPHTRLSQSVESIQKVLDRYDSGESCRWAVVLKESDSLIGIIDLMGLDAPDTFTFAYMLSQEHWGRGYGTEALKAVLDFAFRVCHARWVQADHFAQNIASGRVMEKAGMIRCGILPGKYEKNGLRYDAVQYRLTAEQWAARG